MDYRTALIQSRIDEKTVDAFLSYHAERPEIWAEFERKALELIAAGHRIWGAKSIMEEIRREQRIQRGDGYKISNSFTAYYARVFALKHPQHKDFFMFKVIKGLNENSREAA